MQLSTQELGALHSSAVQLSALQSSALQSSTVHQFKVVSLCVTKFRFTMCT